MFHHTFEEAPARALEAGNAISSPAHLIRVKVLATNLLLPLTHDKHKTIVIFFKRKKLYVLVRNITFGSRGSRIELLGKL